MIPYFLSEETHIIMSRYEAEWMETILLVGALCGLPLTAFCVDKIGRKKSILFACGVLIVTWIVIAVATQIEYIYTFRFFQGLGLNMAFVAAPMYVGEIAHKSIRGFLSSQIYVMSLLGVVIVYVIGPLLPFYVPSIIAIIILATQLLVFSFMPESPYYLASKGQYKQAEDVLIRLRKCNDVTNELMEIRQTIEKDNIEKGRILELVTVKNYRRAMLIMLVLNASQLCCGSEVIIMNLQEILSSAGSVYIAAANASIIFSVINLFASVSASLLVDKFGRKNLVIVSTILTGICIFFIALYFHLQHLGFDTRSYSWLPIVSIMIYAAAFKIGLGMVPIVVTAEVFASKIKAIGMTFADGVYIVSSIAVLQVFFILRDSFGMHVAFYAFFGCSIGTLLCVIYIVPETKGRSLEEIQEILKK